MVPGFREIPCNLLTSDALAIAVRLAPCIAWRPDDVYPMGQIFDGVTTSHEWPRV